MGSRLSEFDERDARLLAQDAEATPPAAWEPPDGRSDSDRPARDREPRTPLRGANDMPVASQERSTAEQITVMTVAELAGRAIMTAIYFLGRALFALISTLRS